MSKNELIQKQKTETKKTAYLTKKDYCSVTLWLNVVMIFGVGGGVRVKPSVV